MFVTRSAIAGTSACSAVRNGDPSAMSLSAGVRFRPVHEKSREIRWALTDPRHGAPTLITCLTWSWWSTAYRSEARPPCECPTRTTGEQFLALRHEPFLDIGVDVLLRPVQGHGDAEMGEGDQEGVRVPLEHGAHHDGGRHPPDGGPGDDGDSDGHGVETTAPECTVALGCGVT